MRTVRAVIVSFPPAIRINASPTGLHDKLVGSGTTFYNWLIVSLNLNFTITNAESQGHCVYDGNSRNASCDGAVGQLADDRADFSLLPMPLTCYDPRIPLLPVCFGPNLYESDMIFASMPYEQAVNQTLTVAHTLHRLPLFYLFSGLVFLLSLILINYSVTRSRRVVRITCIQMYGLMLSRCSGSVKKAYRRILFAACLMTAFFVVQVMQGCTNSDIVVVTPAQYYQTLAEAAGSGLPAAWIRGLTLDDEFRKSNHAAQKKLFQRAEHCHSRYKAQENAFVRLAQGLNQAITFFDSDFEAKCVVGISCFLREWQPLHGLRFSAAIGVSTAILTYSRNIDPDLREILSVFFQRVFETGVYDRYNSDLSSSLSLLGDTRKMHSCLIRLFLNDRPDSVVLPLSLKYFSDLVNMCVLMTCTGTAVLLTELLSGRRKRQKVAAAGWRFVRGRTVVCTTRHPADLSVN